MEAKPPNFAPTGEKIVSLEVEGFEELSCNGRKKCAQHKRLPANTNHNPWTRDEVHGVNQALHGNAVKCPPL